MLTEPPTVTVDRELHVFTAFMQSLERFDQPLQTGFTLNGLNWRTG